jgi:hypothetical protein
MLGFFLFSKNPIFSTLDSALKKIQVMNQLKKNLKIFSVLNSLKKKKKMGAKVKNIVNFQGRKQ